MALAKKVIKYSIGLSILLHIFFLLSFVSVIQLETLPSSSPEPLPSLHLAAYTAPEPKLEPPAETNKNSLQRKAKTNPLSPSNSAQGSISLILPTETQSSAYIGNMSSATQKSNFAKPGKDEDNLDLIGNSKIVKPLAKLLGKALTAHLVYPKIAIDFNLEGKTLVGFNLAPDGTVRDVQIVQSSGAQVLDKAALQAVKAMSPVPGVSAYVEKEEFLVIGIIFSAQLKRTLIY
jgi:periplasmic protein TonB